MIITRNTLQKRVLDAKEQGQKIVMTNGCFDLLHAGHVKYLQEAAEFGDILLVAVNDDSSVKKIKGENRPINTIDKRMSVIDALGCVDWVFSFSEASPEKIICELCPDILVKGKDYDIDEIAGADCVKKSGGEVIRLSLLKDCSTSQIINTIIKSHK